MNSKIGPGSCQNLILKFCSIVVIKKGITHNIPFQLLLYTPNKQSYKRLVGTLQVQ